MGSRSEIFQHLSNIGVRESNSLVPNWSLLYLHNSFLCMEGACAYVSLLSGVQVVHSNVFGRFFVLLNNHVYNDRPMRTYPLSSISDVHIFSECTVQS